MRGQNERCGPCPACGGDDRFSINVAKQVFNCRGCNTGGDVIDLVQHLDGVDFNTACTTLTGEPPPRSKPNGNCHKPPYAEWIYKTEDGTPYLRVKRINLPDGKKSYPQYRWNGSSWEAGKPAGPKIPYRLPELVNTPGQPVFICEGEKCADAVAALGYLATTASEGAGKWTAELNKWFADRTVYILPDNDAVGTRHANIVASNLHGIAREIRVIKLEGLDEGEDVFDWIAREPFPENLLRITEDAPPWEEPEHQEPNDPAVENDDEPAPLLIKTSKQFVADFVTPDYIVDGLLQEGFLYSLTGATGAGKTAITLRLAASTALGVVFAGRETKKRRVLYLAAENPDDVRMRWIALAQQMGFDVDEIEVFFVEGVFKISEVKDQLREEATKLGGDFGLVIIDTSPVFYEGDDENNRKQQGNHAVMLRELINVIPGKPTVIANCHPVKNAVAENLLPAGGGNFLNQVDGNLTAAKTESTTELHTQGKFRGVEFAPMHFLIKTVTHERVKDSRGRLIPTVICEWISDREKENIAAQRVSDEDAVLKIIADDLKATQPSIAIKMNWRLHNGEPNKMKAGRCIKALLKDKLIKESRRGNYILTDDGKKALEQK
jgi:AAA domain/CHC2 zinc finger